MLNHFSALNAVKDVAKGRKSVGIVHPYTSGVALSLRYLDYGARRHLHPFLSLSASLCAPALITVAGLGVEEVRRLLQSRLAHLSYLLKRLLVWIVKEQVLAGTDYLRFLDGLGKHLRAFLLWRGFILELRCSLHFSLLGSLTVLQCEFSGVLQVWAREPGSLLVLVSLVGFGVS